jgi:tetratricopeptide (TPR) repeat protein
MAAALTPLAALLLFTGAPVTEAPARDGKDRESLEEFLARARLKQAEVFARLGQELDALVKRLEALPLPPSAQARDGLVEECVALGAEATPLFVRWLDPGDAALEKERFRARQLAVALQRMDTRAATAELLDLAAKGSNEGRLLAVRVLELSQDSERVRPELLGLYRTASGQVRSTLLRALLKLSSSDTALLDEVFSGDDASLRDVALGALAEGRVAEAEERVHRLLADTAKGPTHAAALLAYYQAQPDLAGPTHVKELIALAASAQVGTATRIAIVDALPLFVETTSNDLRRALEPVLTSADLKLAESARVVLARLGDRTIKRDLLRPYDELIDNSPKWSQAFFRRAEVLRRVGDYKDAEKDYRTALQLGKNEPNSQPDTYIGLARCAALQGHFKEAAEWLEKAPIQLAQLKAYAGDPDFAKLKASKYGDVFRSDP